MSLCPACRHEHMSAFSCGALVVGSEHDTDPHEWPYCPCSVPQPITISRDDFQRDPAGAHRLADKHGSLGITIRLVIGGTSVARDDVCPHCGGTGRKL